MFADRYQNSAIVGPFNSDGDATNVVMKAQGAIAIEEVYVVNTTATATHATNYITMKLLNLGTDATGTTVIATASTSQTGGSAIVAHVPFTLSVTAANKVVNDGEIIAFVRDEATTDAAALAACTIVISYVQVGAP